ncbi:hypothetical protein [Tengunoibacter tsumagoiensis]|uniref:Adenylate kinase n=1 Tax=Tengunoibacter tsumagoiensis TaxID=2014871 RepID=A0A402A7L0_9CHLR|nr:hypothetical protein [Tengunoibacter tsumagoiensis]GCE14966.1 hypothetical protein KTT_48250 [Tengunoibacter tsumagoiensis]
MKITILGGSGSGKTTLATEISVLLNIPHYDLDQFGLKHVANFPAYIEDTFALCLKPDWVAEGCFLLWTDPLLYDSDYIILLEIPWWIASYRILWRHFSKTLRRCNPYPTSKLYRFMNDCRRHYLNRAREVEQIQMRMYLETYPEVIPPFTPNRLLEHWEEYKEICYPPTATFLRQYLIRYREKLLIARNEYEIRKIINVIEKLHKKS